jgi:hypothetical protein
VDFSLNPIPQEASFWDAYTVLWQNSAGQSAFQSPSLLRYFAERTDKTPFVFQCFQNGQWIGAAFFQYQKGVYTFLSDHKTDHNYFVIHRDCSDEELKEFFRQFLQLVKHKKGAFLLNNQPIWAPYMPHFQEAIEESSLFVENLPYSVCPVIAHETPKELFDWVHGNTYFRYRRNKLKRNLTNPVYEAIEGEEGLAEWTDQYCEAHVRRWADTPTPSAFRDPKRIQFLHRCMEAWQRDGLLVRFSVRGETEGRVGFIIGLKQEQSVIFHATTFDPDYFKFSPGIALIHFMAEWMSENGFSILDFGDGDESYKYKVANVEHSLHRIFLSSSSNLPFILKTKMIKTVRNNSKLFDLYREKLKPLSKRMQG